MFDPRRRRSKGDAAAGEPTTICPSTADGIVAEAEPTVDD